MSGARIKLNLGSGNHPLHGYVNVDRFGTPDVLHDLESFPWPWETSSVDEIVLNHVLEHLGETTEKFFGVMKELYRVATPGATVHIAVPHPNHDDFQADPTHVRRITPRGLELFSKKKNDEWAGTHLANTPLARQLDVDFEVVSVDYAVDEPWATQRREGQIDDEGLMRALRQYNNVVKEIRMVVRVVKPDSPTAVARSAERQGPAAPMRPGDEEFHGWYAPGGAGSGRGSTPDYTRHFRTFLEAFLLGHDVRSVLDYGCGDWQWARLVDWGGADYLGVDIVPSLVSTLRSAHQRPGVRFEVVDPEKWIMPQVDLVICKDVLQHLSNQEALSLVRRFEASARWVLYCNDVPRPTDPVNEDTVRGGFRRIDLSKPPFLVPGRYVFDFSTEPDGKAVFLWSREGR